MLITIKEDSINRTISGSKIKGLGRQTISMEDTTLTKINNNSGVNRIKASILKTISIRTSQEQLDLSSGKEAVKAIKGEVTTLNNNTAPNSKEASGTSTHNNTVAKANNQLTELPQTKEATTSKIKDKVVISMANNNKEAGTTLETISIEDDPNNDN